MIIVSHFLNNKKAFYGTEKLLYRLDSSSRISCSIKGSLPWSGIVGAVTSTPPAASSGRLRILRVKVNKKSLPVCGSLLQGRDFPVVLLADKLRYEFPRPVPAVYYTFRTHRKMAKKRRLTPSDSLDTITSRSG